MVYDVFISYGRKESRTFVKELHDRLVAEGLVVWLDQNDIPLGVDFQEQINDGILRSHSFLFVIAPHSINSIYCSREIELAEKYNKRIVPLLHVLPESAEQENEIRSSIRRINWTPFVDESQFESSFSDLLSILQKQRAYVEKHTEMLLRASLWREGKYEKSLLLLGEDRALAETWLDTPFTYEQAPCQPTELQCRYISESKKNATNLHTDVYFVYAESAGSQMNEISFAFTRHNMSCWIAQFDLRTGIAEDTQRQNGIENADNIVLVWTEDMRNNALRMAEFEYAVSLNKRIIGISLSGVSLSQDATFQNIQFTPWASANVMGIIAEIQTERSYFQKHTQVLVAALKWERQNYNQSILFRGYNLVQTEDWLRIASKQQSSPPTELQYKFIKESLAKGDSLPTEVFISYSRSESDFARHLNTELQIHAKNTWFDQESIAPGSAFEQEINNGIRNSDNFLFVISERSVSSPYCEQEILYAQSQKKRFVSILFEEVSLESLPPILAGIQWIDFRPGIKEFHTAFSELLRAIDTDRDHVSAHTRWSLAATKWIDSDRDDEFLLRGVEFEMASVWLQKATEEHKNPEPTAAITSFIEASRLEIQAQSRRKKMAAQRWRFMTVLMTLLAILAFILAGWSYKLLQSSHRAQANATAQRNKAILARRDADQRLVEANVAKKEAEKAKANAQRNYELAVLQQQRAVQNESLAIKKTKEAEANLNRSIESENKARELASFAKMQENLAKASAADAYNRLMETRALNFVAKAREEENKNPTLAMQLALAASNIVSNKEIQSTISSIFYKNNFSIPVLKLDVPIKKIRMLPMGDYFAVLSGSSVVEIYDGAGKKVKSFVGHQAEVTAIDFSADGRYAITASNDRTVRLWDVYTQKSSVLCAKLPKVNDIAFSPDAKFVGLACADNTATIWDRRGNQILVLNKHDASVNAIRFSPDGKYILTGSDDQTAILWNQNGSRKYTLRRHHGAITQVGFSPDKQLILTASADHSIGIWDAKGKVVALLDGHTQAITDACFSFDSQYVLSGSDDKTARMWTVNGEEISLFKGHQAEVTSVRLQAGDSEFAFTASADNTVKKWLLNSNQHTSRTSMLARPSLFEVSQTGYVAICYEKSEDILLLDEHSEPIRKLSKHKSEVKQICFGAKGKILASLDAKSKVFVWSLDGNSIASFTAPYGVITNMKLSPKGDRLAFVVNNRKIAICDLKGNVLGLLSGHIADITGLDFSTDDKNILSVSEDGTSQLWDASYKSINVRNPNYGKASACRFIPRTKLFIVGYANGVIREWDLTGNTKLLFRAGDFAVESITTAADGESFAASYSDKSVRIWDVNSGEMQQFISLQNAIVGYGFASEDKTLIACMSDKTIRNWNRRISIDAYEKKYGFTPLPIAQQIEYGLVDFQTVKESEDINTLIDAASYYSSNTFEIDEKLNLYNQQNSVILLNRAFRKDSTRILVQKRLLKAYSDLSWAFLLTRDPRAEIPARFALQYATETDPLYVRYATALLYNNKWEEAKSIYEQFAQKYYLDTRKKFTEVCAEELDKLDQLGITCNLSLKARELLKNL